MMVDTSTQTPSDKLRTKRVVKLHTPPGDTLARSISETVREMKRAEGNIQEWSEAEKEGLRRMYEMKDEWGLYG
jgi:hypothetical protein